MSHPRQHHSPLRQTPRHPPHSSPPIPCFKPLTFSITHYLLPSTHYSTDGPHLRAHEHLGAAAIAAPASSRCHRIIGRHLRTISALRRWSPASGLTVASDLDTERTYPHRFNAAILHARRRPAAPPTNHVLSQATCPLLSSSSLPPHPPPPPPPPPPLPPPLDSPGSIVRR